MNKNRRHLWVLLLFGAATGLALWALILFTSFKRSDIQSAVHQSKPATTLSTDADLWTKAVEKVKADRGEPAGANAAVEIPPQLRHYSDTHWFLATQVAEVRKYNVQTCRDFVDLAEMIERGEMISLPAVTENYILLGVGSSADDRVFSRYVDDQSIELYSEAGLRDAYGRFDARRSNLQAELAGLKAQLSGLKNRDRTKRRELQKEIAARQQQLKSVDEDRAELDRFYGQPESRQRLLSDYERLRTLAKNFGGRSYNLDDSSDRQAMKISMLRSVKPEALKILEEIASDYHREFDRPLPVSSLVRPEQYQHALNKVNRNAVLIDIPPHSTGLAFDIDYRYMSAAEQSLLMNELARIKDEGRIEVLRERNANYHVFAFINGSRPSDQLITSSLDQASVPVKESNHAKNSHATVRKKSQKAKRPNAKSRVRKRRR